MTSTFDHIDSWPFIAFGFVCINLLAYVVFIYDKRQARSGGWRIPEKTLLGFALIGGSPAILVARRRHRHKTRKQPFVGRLFAIVGLQISLLVFVIYMQVRM